ncbi:MAG: hypothetical protein KF855_18075 [Acidobacteria bacterium]|nr:hypothetical protein [Acidobacteriota bacterium]
MAHPLLPSVREGFRLIRMGSFGKKEECPSSQELLAFQNGDLSIEECRKIGRHMGSCEFCAAEAEFYERYPLIDEPAAPVRSPDMPKPLHDLAEALIGRKRGDVTYDELIREINFTSRRK